jgi:ribonuclease R
VKTEKPSLARLILAHVATLPHGRAKFKQLVRELGARGDARAGLEEVLQDLVTRGDLIETRNGYYILPQATREYAAGRLNMHRDGYGFLIADAPAPGVTGDIYIPRESAEKAMHGDRVLVRIARIETGGRASGEIVRVLARAHATVVGEFRVRDRGNYVIPHDDRLHQWILIPDGMEMPAQTLSVDRVGAKPLDVKEAADLDGMIVNAEILEFPERGERGVGRVVEILGRPDDFGVDVEIMIRRHHIPHQFPPEALEEARTAATEVSEPECQGRRDFRASDVITIDGETARDFDDAVQVEALPNGNYRLSVHIADVSHYVKPGSAIDTEARLRGTSVYFPDRAVPMLPVELSTGICSLKPGVDRLVLSAILEIDRQGDIVAQEFTRGVIRSAARMTYTAVHEILEGDPAAYGRFALMRELATILNKKRFRRGSIDFDLPEPLIEFDEFGEMTGVTRGPRNIAHRIIEEFMLAANEAVAGHMEHLGVPMIFRIHEQPDPKRVMDFEEVAAQFGYSLGVGAIPVKRHSIVNRRRDGTKQRRDLMLPSGTGVTSRNYQKLVEQIAGKPEERILSHLMLRSLKQARYSAENRGHFALASQSYTHFTSPIRRYPDLMVHRILAALLDGREPGASEDELSGIAIECSTTERRAAEAERELVEWKKARFMEERVGEEFPSLIVSTTRFGFFVELEELFIEGLVPIDFLPGDRYLYQERTHKIVGQRTRREFSIGQRVTVRLDRVDAMERKLQFAVVEEKGPRKKRKS